ncbi:2Fe-2S iron-sulfur cluster binding domain-containing protein [Mucilaginibacter sp. HC2]|uniref:2Fe-2S iron-sulfur cluster-binding protein n=1 Tax=Mucilaginibacter inviolabilis TaxID=2714892 RepID=UPI00140E4CCF|nr:2Fe-2S iron-sulfur cluster-binding protein [Mucilaginibacter inviolabilis]NHA04296.1 2Fe-2S iron-sulfur cluster binding domain-containing protein [Mucilaginibacter inviolabilis]
MPTPENIILFKVAYLGRITEVHTYPNQYYSLMTLISDQLAIPGFGLCCGMGSCGTCLVQINNGYHQGVKNVLACAVGVNDELTGAVITISGVF